MFIDLTKSLPYFRKHDSLYFINFDIWIHKNDYAGWVIEVQASLSAKTEI